MNHSDRFREKPKSEFRNTQKPLRAKPSDAFFQDSRVVLQTFLNPFADLVGTTEF
jgi:hypothetical protein